MLMRVAGPTEREALVETISTYSTCACVAATQAASGTAACPPHVTMQRFGSCAQSARLSAGMHSSPSFAGVRSMTGMPRGSSSSQWRRASSAEVASKTRSKLAGRVERPRRSSGR